jgi:G:T-mismatch repair DNA endonuclease (very short patch repair protein)
LVRLCSVKECNNKHIAKGFCQKHYDKLKLYGNPLHVIDPKETAKKISKSNKGRSSPMKGKKQTEETKRKISKSSMGKNLGKRYPGELNPFFGKKHSDGTKKTMSELKKGIAPWNKGKVGIYSKETLEKMSKSSKIIQNRPDVKQANREKHTGKKYSKETKQKISAFQNRPDVKQANRERLRDIRHNQVKPNNRESQIGQILTEAGIRFKFHRNVDYQTIENEHRKKEVDVFIRPKKIIEHNGTYNHADPRKYKPDDLIREHNKMVKASEIWKREKIILNQIKKQGYKILVVWEQDLLKDSENTKNKILKFAKS